MARRKAEAALQNELENQDQWDEMLSREGLIVIDIYQGWCGPCAAMVANLKRLRNELSDDLLHFAAAKADCIDVLDRYRGRCEPCYGFYAGGQLVAVVHGANAPLIEKTIKEQLQKERQINDPSIAKLETAERADNAADSAESGSKKKEVTVAIIKPDVVAAGKVNDVIAEIEACGIEILAHEKRQLTENEAREFYASLAGEAFYEELVQYMISCESHVLVLSKGEAGDSIIEEWRQLLGPKDMEEARRNAPESLRAKFGANDFKNALHGSEDSTAAAKELAFFFADFKVPTIGGPAHRSHFCRTLALIRPKAVGPFADQIKAKIEEAGFEIAMSKLVHITADQARRFYQPYENEPWFDKFIDEMTSGPLLALCLARENAVEEWRKLIGPKMLDEAKRDDPDCLRSKFSVEGSDFNQLHGADTVDDAEKQLEMFFPRETTLACIKPNAMSYADDIKAAINQAGFEVVSEKLAALSADDVAMLYPNQTTKDYYPDLERSLRVGETLLLVLNHENAVDQWREMMGPTDPHEAKELFPESLRARFGQSLLLNGLHGSSSPGRAAETIKSLFGDLVEYDENGLARRVAWPDELGLDAPPPSEQQGAPEAAAPDAHPLGANPRQPTLDDIDQLLQLNAAESAAHHSAEPQAERSPCHDDGGAGEPPSDSHGAPEPIEAEEVGQKEESAKMESEMTEAEHLFASSEKEAVNEANDEAAADLHEDEPHEPQPETAQESLETA